jgi:UDP-glucose 4-epimerase
MLSPDLPFRHALVTGGAGFIGSHLVAALCKQGVAVRVLDDLSTGKRANLAGLPAELVEGDVASADTVLAAATGCDLIFHLAALVSVPRSLEEPALNHATNVNGTFHVLEAARRHAIRRVVYASSSAVYGNRPGQPKRESDPPAPVTPYAAAKLMGEQMAAAWAAGYGLEPVGLRFMNVFGPRQDPSSPYSGVLSIFCERVLRGEGVTIHGDGQQSRDFVFVDDVAQALLLAAQMAWNPATAVFNVGRGEETTLLEVVALLEGWANRPIPVHHAADRPGDIRHSCADIGRLHAVTGYTPRVSVAEGLHATLAWMQETPSA